MIQTTPITIQDAKLKYVVDAFKIHTYSHLTAKVSSDYTKRRLPAESLFTQKMY